MTHDTDDALVPEPSETYDKALATVQINESMISSLNDSILKNLLLVNPETFNISKIFEIAHDVALEHSNKY